LSQWLVQQGVEQVHGCLEATSIYGHALAILVLQGFAWYRLTGMPPIERRGNQQIS
jgi:hypothetical protein